MKKRYLFCCTIISIFIYSCSQHSIPANEKDYSGIPNTSCSRLEYIQLLLDTLTLSGATSSMEGKFLILNDTLFWADEVSGNLLSYDKEGKYLGKVISKGVGPDEVAGIHAASVSDKGFVFFDQHWNIYLFNKNRKRTHSFVVDWNSKYTLNDQMNNPNPEDPGIYEYEYHSHLIKQLGQEYVIIPLVTEHRDQNPYEGKKAGKFYEETYALGMISINSHKLEKLLCRYPPLYNRYHFLPTFKNIIYDIQGEQLFYSFEADSLIYSFNTTDSTTNSFGNRGREMKVEYPTYNQLKEAEKNLRRDRNTFGYYRYLKIMDDGKLLFRSYQKGDSPLPDGLQIYRSGCLVADIDVPRGFEMIGYIAPWYYAFGHSDFEKETLTLYRFKLD